MRENFGGLSVILGAIIVTIGLIWAASSLALRLRYSAAAAGDAVVVVDHRTGQVQTFERSKQPPHNFVYVGTHSRTRAREERESTGGGKAPANGD